VVVNDLEGYRHRRFQLISAKRWIVVHRIVPAMLSAALLASCAASSIGPSEQVADYCSTTSEQYPAINCRAASCDELSVTAERLRKELAAQWARIGRSAFPQTELERFAFTYWFPFEFPIALGKMASAETERRTTFETRRAQLANVERLLRDKECPAVSSLRGQGVPTPTGIEFEWLLELPRSWYMPKPGAIEPQPPP
jgi:hypothetical protein